MPMHQTQPENPRKVFQIVKPFRPLFIESDEHYGKRYLAFYGGRGSAKSVHAGMACLVRARRQPIKILCARQFQNSMKDSVLSLLDGLITQYELNNFFKVTNTGVQGSNGSEFICAGLHNNLNSIRSMTGIGLCWIEEAQALTEKAYEVLIPTIRAPGSQFILTYNVDLETDPTYQRFNVKPPPNAFVRKVNYDENPFFPDELRQEMEYLRSVDTDAYLHVWEGEPRVHSDAQIFNGKWEIARFEPPADAQYMHGMDFGFSQDPTTAVRCYEQDANLYIYQEAYRNRLDVDHTAEFVKTHIPGIENYTVRGDSARPETISFLARNGIPNIIGVDKWKGSVEDGITVLRSFRKIIIHEQCRNMIQEAKLYSYKIHDKTGDILPEVVDKNNHMWDAVRYACDPIIQQSKAGLGWLAYMKSEFDKHKSPSDNPH